MRYGGMKMKEKPKMKLIRMPEELFNAIAEIVKDDAINYKDDWGDRVWRSQSDFINAALKSYINEKKGEKHEKRYL